MRLSRRSLPRPISSDFEQAGITSALDRLSATLPPEIPAWLWRSRHHVAHEQLCSCSESDLVQLIRCVDSLAVRPCDIQPPRPSADWISIQQRGSVASWATHDAAILVASLCMRVGMALEKIAVDVWERRVGEEVVGPAYQPRARQRSKRRVLSTEAFQMFDAYASAVWTSVHAEYLDGAPDQSREQPSPSLHSVISQSTELNISNLLDARGMSQHSQGKMIHPMNQLLQRCVNPAARGWCTSLSSIVKRHAGPRRVIGMALVVCLSAMHPCIAPPDRAGWRIRMIASRRAQAALLIETAHATISSVPSAAKEATRRMLGGLLVDSIAARNVAHRIGSPSARLVTPPLDAPPAGMLHNMRLLAQAGALCATDDRNVSDAIHAMYPSVVGGTGKCAAVEDDDEDAAATVTSSIAWIGRSKQRSCKPRLVDRASDCFSNAFKSEFLPFWMRATSCGARPHRLDTHQHAEIHSKNAALQLCMALPREEALRVQRIVLHNHESPLLCTTKAAQLIGLAVPGGSARDFDSPLESMAPRTAALLLHFARVSWVSEQLLIVDLGKRTRALQVAAIAYRHLHAAEGESASDEQREALVSTLPKHITNLCVCVECSRVTNCTPRIGKGYRAEEFSETGVSAVTICHELSEVPRLYCSKRSSAALRSAITAESVSRKRRIDEDELMQQDASYSVLQAMMGMAHDGSVASRMRRDCKRALEQRSKATLCGESELLTIPLIGRAVRVVGAWYALCAFCGGCFKAESYSRIEAELACLSCVTTNRSDKHKVVATTAAKRPTCRFCRRVEAGRLRSFVTHHSPHDVSDGNLAKPPARRTTSWCPKHNRAWLPDALRTLTSAQVLAHIAHRVRPCASIADEDDAAKPPPSHHTTSKRKRPWSKKRKIK